MGIGPTLQKVLQQARKEAGVPEPTDVAREATARAARAEAEAERGNRFAQQATDALNAEREAHSLTKGKLAAALEELARLRAAAPPSPGGPTK